MTHDGNCSEPELSGSSPMGGTPQPDDLARLRNTAGWPPPCRPGFPAPVLRRPRPGSAGASAFVRLSLDVSRVLCEMGFAETAISGLWSVILPGLAGGKPIDRARWVLLGAEACAASNEGGCTVSRLADTVERDALDTPAGPAQRFLRTGQGSPRPPSTAGATIAGRSRSSPGHLPSLADAQLAPLGFRALLMLVDEAITQDRLGLTRGRRSLLGPFSGATRQVSFLEAEWSRRLATVLALEGRVDEAVAEFRRGIALCERQGWYAGFAYVELLVGLGALYAQTGQKQRAGRTYDDALRALVVGRRQQGAAFDDLCPSSAAGSGGRHASAVHTHRASVPAPALADPICRGGAPAARRHGLRQHHRHPAACARVRPYAWHAHRHGRGRAARSTLAHPCGVPGRRLRPLGDGPTDVVRQPVLHALSDRRRARRGIHGQYRELGSAAGSEPVDDTAANELLDQALAGINAKALARKMKRPPKRRVR